MAQRTRATLYLSDEGDADWTYRFAGEATLLHHGDRLHVGNVRVAASSTRLATPPDM